MNTKKQIKTGEGQITDLDLENYTGKEGQKIWSRTRWGEADDGVHIAIVDLLGVVIEEGPCTWDDSSGRWCYVAQQTLPPGELYVLRATVGHSRDKANGEVLRVPLDLEFPIDLNSEARATTSGLSRYRNN